MPNLLPTKPPPVSPTLDPTKAGGATTPWPGLKLASDKADLALSDDQLGRFSAYRDLLKTRTERTNLTAIRDPAEIERKLIFAALLMLPALDAAITNGETIATPRLVDIGSGAGFPGLALTIARPRWRVTLIEATGKKVAFLDEAIMSLGLDGATALHARAEDIGHRAEHRGGYDLATARAVATLPALVELAAPLLRLGGCAFFPKGSDIAHELHAASYASAIIGVRLVAPIPLSDGTQLIRAIKSAPTPSHFPRRAGLPAREPLGGSPSSRVVPPRSTKSRTASPKSAVSGRTPR